MKKPTTKRMTKRMIIMLLMVGVLFAAIIGYQMFVASMMAKFLASNTQPPATVTAMQVSNQSWQPQIAAVGTLRAIQGVDISAETSGVVKKVHFKSGDWVKQGDLLIELNVSEETAQLQALRASRKLADITFKRDKQQYKIHAISKAQLDISQAELSNRQAQVAQQQAIIDKKRIRAPFDGRLGVSQINPGQFLNVAQQIVSLQNNLKLYVDFNLPQKFVGMIKRDQEISISVQQQSGALNATATNSVGVFKGRINTINAVVDNSTRNVLLEGVIDNADGVLLPGMFAHVKVESGAALQLLTLPQTAISFNAYGSTLFVAKSEKGADGKETLVAQQVFVKTGEKRGDQVAVLEGLKEGDRVVTSGQLKLKNGTPLIINNSVQPANNAAPKPQEH
ncbi:efflux RND transporter periplasmic adaptor subunit [Mariprofundus sp. EBB-1]|uniref:efflux RND transporter periplasmic adaptor subunit n=1 Tax=Mariprofundus sp. EBB-1 TaxID=2650971 RepID=UPI001913FDE1|nr:efflux RND transporter periplasmic adaptor subunit [Mariprofundus sp. EBB-1]